MTALTGATASRAAQRPDADGSTHRRSIDRDHALRPLLAVLCAVVLFGLAWALLTPAWQAPDENAHFAYTQTLAERLALPGSLDRPIFSSEQQRAAAQVQSDQAAGVLAGRVTWSRNAYDRWRASQTALKRDDGGGPNPASSNPPLYYLTAAAAYEVAGGDVFTRLVAARLVGVAYLALTALTVWLLVGEVLGRDRLLQVAATAVVGLAPMLTFISASVTPDSLTYALWGFVMWLGVRILKRGLTLRDSLAIGSLAAAAILVKATSYALVPGVIFVLLVGIIRLRSSAGARPAFARATFGLCALLVPVLIWFVVARVVDQPAAAQVANADRELTVDKLRALISYLWQFYLPRLPFQDPARTYDELGLWNRFVEGGWGRFGWQEITLPFAIYVALAGFTAASLAGAGAALVRARQRVDWTVVAFLALVSGVLLAGLHWTDFSLNQQNIPFMQGRYLLPLAPLGGLSVVVALRWIPRPLRASAIAVLVASFAALQVLSLGEVLVRFYA
jgi:4-amino-4-deoxy-L-arabinose transferase-like glycosyltransferase